MDNVDEYFAAAARAFDGEGGIPEGEDLAHELQQRFSVLPPFYAALCDEHARIMRGIYHGTWDIPEAYRSLASVNFALAFALQSSENGYDAACDERSYGPDET